MTHNEELKRRQDAAQRAHDRMMTMLISFQPTQKLKIEDALFVASMAQTYTFDALDELSKQEPNP